MQPTATALPCPAEMFELLDGMSERVSVIQEFTQSRLEVGGYDRLTVTVRSISSATTSSNWNQGR